MLVIKGKAGKSKVLMESFVSDHLIVVETVDLSLSKMMDNEYENTQALQLPSNDIGNQISALKLLDGMFGKKGTINSGFVNIIFYLNVKEEDIERFVDFEKNLNKGFNFIRLILTVQSENEELEYFEYK